MFIIHLINKEPWLRANSAKDKSIYMMIKFPKSKINTGEDEDLP